MTSKKRQRATDKVDEFGRVTIAGVQLGAWAKVLGGVDVELLNALILAAMVEDRMRFADRARSMSRDASGVTGPVAVVRLADMVAETVADNYPAATKKLLREIERQGTAKWLQTPVEAAAEDMAQRAQPGGVRKAEGHGEQKH